MYDSERERSDGSRSSAAEIAGIAPQVFMSIGCYLLFRHILSAYAILFRFIDTYVSNDSQGQGTQVTEDDLTRSKSFPSMVSSNTYSKRFEKRGLIFSLHNTHTSPRMLIYYEFINASRSSSSA